MPKVTPANRIKCGEKTRRAFRPSLIGACPAPFGRPRFKTVKHFAALRRYTFIKLLGEGQNGTVSHVRLHNGIEVALKRFNSPALAMDCTIRLLSVVPHAFDLKMAVTTRAAFDAHGVFVHVQQMGQPICYTDPLARRLVMQTLQTLSTDLAAVGVAHDDIKRDNFVWATPEKNSVLLCDLDSLTATTNSPRPTRHDGIGAHTQFIFGASCPPTTIQSALELATYTGADFHLAYKPVQAAMMLFSCLMTAIELAPLTTQGSMPPIWHIAIKHGNRIDMEALRTHALHHEALFVAFCDAWAKALPIIMAEPGAAAIMAGN